MPGAIATDAALNAAQLLEATLASTTEGVVVYGPRGEILRINAAAEKILGVSQAEAAAETPQARAACLRPRTPEGAPVPAHETPTGKALRGESSRGVEIVLDRPRTGERLHVSVSAAPIRGPDGVVHGAVTTFSDVTEHRRAEQSLRELDRRKTEFLAMLSHELRNPLAPIQNSLYLLERAAPGTAQASRAKQVMRRQAEHLTRLLDDLLDVTRISRGTFELHRTRLDLCEVVRRTAEDLRSLFDQSSVALQLADASVPAWVDADPTRIAQVVSNLLHNAVKFTPAGGTVTAGVTAGEGRSGLYVRDTGVGIEPGQIERMFEPFAQAEQSLARTKGGLGLGLALVKSIVELHGGKVRAWSAGKGRGAEFVVTLPSSRAGAPAAGAGGSRL